MGKSEILGGQAAKAKAHKPRALSAWRARWQSPDSRTWRAIIAAGLALGAGWVTPAQAGPEGPIATMRRGDYMCEFPGDALGPPGRHVPAEDFKILQGSIYDTATGRGYYLLTGNDILMTTGPFKGKRYRRISENLLRQLGVGENETDMRCVRRVLNNQ